MRFIGSAPGDARSGEPALSDVEGKFPDNVITLLSRLKCFPNLEILGVEFANDFADYHEWEEGIVDLLSDEEYKEEVEEVGRGEVWMALMKSFWEAVLGNQTYSFTGVVGELPRVIWNDFLETCFCGKDIVFGDYMSPNDWSGLLTTTFIQ